MRSPRGPAPRSMQMPKMMRPVERWSEHGQLANCLARPTNDGEDLDQCESALCYSTNQMWKHCSTTMGLDSPISPNTRTATKLENSMARPKIVTKMAGDRVVFQNSTRT